MNARELYARELYDNAVVTPVFKEWYLGTYKTEGVVSPTRLGTVERTVVRARWDVTVKLAGTMPLEFHTGFRRITAPDKIRNAAKEGRTPFNFHGERVVIEDHKTEKFLKDHIKLLLAPNRSLSEYDSAFLRVVYPEAPTKFDILYCLCSDMGIAENCGTFEYFCAELGYDEDSRKAEATWKAVLEQTNRFRSIGATQELCGLLRDIDNGDQPT